MTAISLNGLPAHEINDSNWSDYVPDANFRLTDNKGNKFFTGCIPISTWNAATMKTVPFAASGIIEYDEKELAERLEAMWAAQASLMHMMYKYDCLNQSNGTCWIHGSCQCSMVNFVQMGYTKENGLYRIPSPMSVAYHCYNNYGVRGGYPTLGIEKYQEHGACTIDYWPENSTRDSYDTAESKANRIHQIPEEVVELGSGEQGMIRSLSAVCQGIPCGNSFNWWSHYLPVTWGRYDGGQLKPGVWNTWGPNGYGDRGHGLLAGSRRLPSYAVAILRMRQSAGEKQ